jgi:hypothetical protein
VFIEFWIPLALDFDVRGGIFDGARRFCMSAPEARNEFGAQARHSSTGGMRGDWMKVTA